MKACAHTFALCCILAAPLSAQSLGERAQTEEPTCAVIADAYELCLVDGIIVSQGDAMLASVEDGISYFGSGDGLISQAEARAKDLGLSAYYRNEVRPLDPAVAITELGKLTPDDYGSYTFSTTSPNSPGASPHIVSVLDLGAFDVLVVSTFPNFYGLERLGALSDSQLEQHVKLLTAFRPLSDS